MAAAPDTPGPLFHLCCVLLTASDPAANTLLPQLARFPNHAPGWLALGQALLPQQPAAALVAFTRAHATAPGVASAVGRSAALSRLGRHAEAAEACRGLGDARAAFQMGLALRAAGDLPAAAAAFAEAARLRPEAPEAWHALGVIRQDQGDHEAAIPVFRAALAAAPRSHEAAFNLGVAYQETGALEPALDAYAAAWRLDPAQFGRIAQALVSPRVGRLWLHPDALRAELSGR